MAATYFFRNVGTSYNTGTNWSLTTGGGSAGIVPGAGDTAVFDGNSGNCTQDLIGATLATLSFANYGGTFTVSNNITATGDLLKTGGSTATVNGSQFLIGGNITISGGTLIGTTEVVLNGTGTWSGAGGILGTSLTFNTAGTITVSGSVIFYNGTLLYTSGTVITASSTLAIGAGVSATINSNGSTSPSATTTSATGINWNNVTSNGTITNNSNLCVVGNFITSAGSTATINGSSAYLLANLTLGLNASLAGTSTINLIGTGTWSSSGGSVLANLVFNTSGTITISGTVSFGGSKTLTYTAGTIVVTSSTLYILSSATLATSGMSWNDFKVTNTITITLSSDLNISGNFVRSGNGTTCTLNSNNINISGGLTAVNLFSDDCNLAGTSTINLIGTGNWDGHQSVNTYRVIGNTLNINTSGTYTITGGVSVTGTFNYVAGTVITAGSDLLFGGTLTCSLNGILWDKVSITDTITVTLSSDIHCETLKRGGTGGTCTLNGSFIYMSSLTVVDVASTWSILTGTTKLVFNGNGVWTGHTSSGMGVGNSVIIDTAGLLTLTDFIVYQTGTLTYLKGIVKATSATLNIVGSCAFSDVHKILFGNGVVFTSGVTITSNRFFNGTGYYPCAVRPSAAGNMNVTLTYPSISEFVSVKNVVVSATGYALRIATRDGDKIGNSGNVIFMSGQQPTGLLDEEDYRNHFGFNGFVNDWGQGPQGLVRNT